MSRFPLLLRTPERTIVAGAPTAKGIPMVIDPAEPCSVCKTMTMMGYKRERLLCVVCA